MQVLTAPTRHNYYSSSMATDVGVSFRRVTDHKGIDLIVVVIVPERPFIGVYLSWIIGFGVASGVIAVFVFAAGVFLCVLTMRSLYRLLSKMRLVESMKLDEIIDQGFSFSFLAEIRQMQTTFYGLVLRLQEYKSFLPRCVHFSNYTYNVVIY
jgi:hypothetical protein